MTPEQVLEQIQKASISRVEREQRLFYAELYIGLDQLVRERPDAAAVHLREAVGNTWAPQAGYGPQYMWHVGRLQYDLLRKREASRVKPAAPAD